MPSALDLKGRRFDHFVVLNKVGKNKHGYLKWLCQCDCGNQFQSTSQALSKGKRKSCGCQSYVITRRVKRIQDPKDISFKRCINRTKQSAKKRKIQWSLSYNLALKLIRGNCYYCNSKPSRPYNVYLTNTTDRCSVRHREYAEKCWIKINGIDRINSNGHYTSNNVVTCCKNCNQAKNTMTQKEFWEWIKKVYHYGKTRSNK